jgi:hypothetical protein
MPNPGMRRSKMMKEGVQGLPAKQESKNQNGNSFFQVSSLTFHALIEQAIVRHAETWNVRDPTRSVALDFGSSNAFFLAPDHGA